jgi:isoleucyl-tRNA synthetase
MTEKKNYKDTLNLPKTDFPMKANLPQKEPEQIKIWEENKIYEKIIEKNSSKPKYILHDGPPYANGKIHMGTALNKILKDITVRNKNMSGFCSPYIPGWDCHGLPIELQVEKKYGKTSDINETIKRCRNYAASFVGEQKKTFKRLGVYGDWDNPYLTMNKTYEAKILKELASIVEKNAIFREDKPVYWCASCGTALAEAEVEYKDHTSSSIYVKFKLDKETSKTLNLDENTFVAIWTTTPWTLPANLAITMHPDFEYGVYEKNGENWILAKDLFENVVKDIGEKEIKFKEIKTLKGTDFNKLNTNHPFFDRKSILINGTHVTLEAGTGCVHTAPGHGLEDYIIGKEYGLEIYNPVDGKGCFYKDLPLFGGVNIKEANKKIIEYMKENGSLIYTDKITHSYPHCWRCKEAVIFRATPQWFISMEKTNLRKKALKEIEKVDWVPGFGEKRISSMIENRPDWCISRQRKWGVPIIAFQCDECGDTVLDHKIINKVANMVEKEGIEAWHNLKVKDIISDTCQKCKKGKLQKGSDILDVWFDSGISHAAVCENNPKLSWPVDLYLEGSDQHRGWFHTSLLESILTRDCAPYKKVVTHGFIVDKKGYKMSKSLGNVVNPEDLIKQSGADILRLWAIYENFTQDISYSEESYKRVTESYRRIRNTFRFMLGNISDLKEKIPYKNLRKIDKFILHRLNNLIKDIRTYYENFEYYKIFQAFNNFFISELSSFYLDISKDILYVNKKDDHERRCIQTVIKEILCSTLRLIAPVIPFTSEEAWNHIEENSESIHMQELPNVNKEYINEEIGNEFKEVLLVREQVSKALEEKRTNKEIGHSLDADIKLKVDKKVYSILSNLDSNLSSIFIVSNLELAESNKTEIEIKKSEHIKCARCWQYKKEVGTLEDKEICTRCLNAIK